MRLGDLGEHIGAKPLTGREGVYEIKVGATVCARPKSLQIDGRECSNGGQ